MCRSSAEGGRRCPGPSRAHEAARKQRYRATQRLAAAIAATSDMGIRPGEDLDAAKTRWAEEWSTIERRGAELATAEEQVQATACGASPARPDRLRQMTEDIFRDGQCHALALALHEHTGWPIVGLWSPETGFDEHYMARMPDGRLVDVMGAADAESVVGGGDWVGCEPRPVGPETLTGLVERGDMEEPTAVLARAVVPQVLAKVQGDGTA